MTPPEAAPMREDVTQSETLKWRERWYGSEPQKGSSIVDERGNLIAYFGGDEATHKAATAAVSAHNATLAHTARPDAGDEVERVGTCGGMCASQAGRLCPCGADGRMREGVDRGMVEVPREVVAFLKGEGPLGGQWFGDPKPAGERGNFWWRKHLPNLAALSRKGG